MGAPWPPGDLFHASNVSLADLHAAAVTRGRAMRRPSLLARLRARLLPKYATGGRVQPHAPSGPGFVLDPDGSGRFGPVTIGMSWHAALDQDDHDDQLLAGILRRFIADPTAYVYAEPDARQVCLDGWVDLSADEEALLIRLNQEAKAARAARDQEDHQ